MINFHFTRRDFIKTMGLGITATMMPFMGNCQQSRLDRFGGLESVHFDATGLFRIEKGNRWWLVTPDGGAFLSFGLNHADVEYLLQDYNIDFWREKFGFKDPSESAFQEGFVNKVMKDLEVFGMNTIGTHARKEVLGKLTVPYTMGLFFAHTAYWLVRSAEDYPDVFSAAYEKRCERIARRLCLPRKDDPFLIGYTFTNVPILTDRDADARGEPPMGSPTPPWGGPSQPDMPTWPRALRNRGPKEPCKKAFVDQMKERYPNIRSFNRTYKTRFSSFDTLLDSVDWSPVVKTAGIEDADDNHAFLNRIYERYYTVTCDAVQTFDPNHLIFGDPINANTPPPDDIVSMVASHADVIAYQYFGGYDDQSAILDQWARLTGKPLFNTDSCFCVPYEEMPAPAGVVCSDQETRARLFLDFASRAFSRPDFIGWHWCGWVDAWAAWRKVRQHSGLQDPFGRYHHPMPETMARFGSRLYDYARGKRKPVVYRSV